MRSKLVHGHVVRVGSELDSGPGIRIHVNYVDRTDEFLSIVGPPMEDAHGMPIPRGESWAMTEAELRLDENGEFRRVGRNI